MSGLVWYRLVDGKAVSTKKALATQRLFVEVLFENYLHFPFFYTAAIIGCRGNH